MKNFIHNYKKDIMIMTGLLTVAIAAYFIIPLIYGTGGNRAGVYIDGQLYASYDLMDSQRYRIPVGNEYNEVLIEHGNVRVSSSSCRNQVCVNHTPISKNGESIICLPHKLVIKIENKKETGLDGIAE
ncbi:MAG: NusG domain II-containing protein [Lachnospiraceae bacterium]|nr:NusG domain II-containing protein [Lachnospiraceae bacterium]